jgi:L-lactate dehydrogenase complex protein LldG
MNVKSSFEKRVYLKMRSALGHDPLRRRLWSEMGLVEQRPPSANPSERREPAELVATLIERSKINGMTVTVCAEKTAAAEKIAGIVKKYLPKKSAPAHVVAWRHHLIDNLKLDDVLQNEWPQIKVHPADAGGQKRHSLERLQAKDLAATAICGVTAADWCLADSATLVMRSRPGQGRAVSLLPPVHIAVISQANLIGHLGDLYALLARENENSFHGLTNCMTFISGPSTTRDIESIAVSGAHGPKAVHIVVVN